MCKPNCFLTALKRAPALENVIRIRGVKVKGRRRTYSSSERAESLG